MLICVTHGIPIPCVGCEIHGTTIDAVDTFLAKDIQPVLTETQFDWAKKWSEFHRMQNPSLGKLEAFIASLPKFCECGEHLQDIIVRNPPRFDDWPKWTWEIHNSVNTMPHLNKPLMSWPDYQACWLGIAPLTKPRLIITVATGAKFVELLQLTRPLMESYAQKCNADFVALTNKLHDQWQREKFRVFDFATQYAETLFVDVDCIIRPDTDNLFDQCKGYDVGMHDDLPRISKDWDWREEYRSILQSQDTDPSEAHVSNNLWNSGVVYCTRQSATIWQPPIHRLPDSHCSVQFLVQYQTSPYKIKSLASIHNWQYWFSDFDTGVDGAQIVHLANHTDKLAGVAKYL